MEKEKLEKFRKLLLEAKRKIINRVLAKENVMKSYTDEALTVPEELDDYARMDYTEILLDELENVEIEILREIDKALERIEEGTYGYCDVCGKPIEEKRLEAIPWTTLCIEHAKEAEKYKVTPDRIYEDYLEKGLIPYDEELEKEVKEEGLDK